MTVDIAEVEAHLLLGKFTLTKGQACIKQALGCRLNWIIELWGLAYEDRPKLIGSSASGAEKGCSLDSGTGEPSTIPTQQKRKAVNPSAQGAKKRKMIASKKGLGQLLFGDVRSEDLEGPKGIEAVPL